MLPSGPAAIRTKTINNPSTTARASRFCAAPGDTVDRISCSSSETTAAVFSIRATPGRLDDTPEAAPSMLLRFRLRRSLVTAMLRTTPPLPAGRDWGLRRCAVNSAVVLL